MRAHPLSTIWATFLPEADKDLPQIAVARGGWRREGNVAMIEGRTMGVRQLRSELAEAVRRAATGDRTVITTSGTPVAQLAPLDADAPALDALVASGAVIPPRRTSPWRAPEPVRVWAGVRIDQVLRELRG